jgi:signal transduction histidine kinase
MKLGITVGVNLSIFIGTTLTTALLALYFYNNLLLSHTNQIQNTIRTILEIVPFIIDKEYITTLKKDSNKSKKYFLEWLKLKEVDNIYGLNIFILTKKEDDEFIFLYDTVDNPIWKGSKIDNNNYISSEDWLDDSNKIPLIEKNNESDNYFLAYQHPPKEMNKSYLTESLEIVEEYTDEYGTFRSGFKCIKLNENVKIIIGIDYNISDIKKEENLILRIILIVLFFTFIINFLISKYLKSLVTRPIIELSNNSIEIKKGNYAEVQNLYPYNKNNEIGQLYENYSSMVSSLLNNYNKIQSYSRELFNLSKIKDQFLSNLSHELNTPLTVILSYSELITMEESSNEKINEHANEIMIAGQKLKSYLEDLIIVTMIESKIEIMKNHFNLSEEIEDIVQSYSIIKTMNIDVTIHLEIKTLFVDRGLFRKALNSIISNSILYNRVNGKILISSKQDKGTIEIKIEDTGIGISDEKITYVFDKFYRVDSSDTYEVSGVGLGLFITKNILDLHEVGYSIESKLGKGTIFRIFL